MADLKISGEGDSSRLKRLARQFTPAPVQIYLEYKRCLRDCMPKEQAANKAKQEIKSYGTKIIAAGAIYQATAHLYGVGAWNPAGQTISDSVLSSASQLAKSFGSGLDQAIPNEIKHSIAAIIVPIEISVSVIRMAVEQKLWLRFGMTSDPAGVIWSPAAAGILELFYKATQKYAVDEDQRIVVASVGILGNLARLVNDGVIYAVLNFLEKRKGLTKAA